MFARQIPKAQKPYLRGEARPVCAPYRVCRRAMRCGHTVHILPSSIASKTQDVQHPNRRPFEFPKIRPLQSSVLENWKRCEGWYWACEPNATQYDHRFFSCFGSNSCMQEKGAGLAKRFFQGLEFVRSGFAAPAHNEAVLWRIDTINRLRGRPLRHGEHETSRSRKLEPVLFRSSDPGGKKRECVMICLSIH